MGLFDKKYCDVCSEKIGLLGNRKLDDGNLCKDCARKLSPFFSDRRHSTVEEIKQQLAYRENNKQVLSAFAPMMTYGEEDKIYVDTAKGSFVVSRRTPGNWSEENPDVISLSAISSCSLRTDEDREEIYTTNSNGESISYNPPRFNFFYDFYIDINVNHPYFDEISVKLNDNRVEGMGTMEYNRFRQIAQQVIYTLTPGAVPSYSVNNFGTSNNPAMNGYNQNYQGYNNPAYQPQNMPNQPYGNPYPNQNPYQGQNVNQNPYPNQPVNQNPYSNQPVNQNPYQGQNVNQAWLCPACGGNNNGGKFCSFCGTPRQ